MGLWGLLGGVATVVAIGVTVTVARADAALVGDARAALRRPVTWLVGVPALAVTLLVGLPYLYLQSVGSAPARPLTFADLGLGPGQEGTTTSTTSGAGPTTSSVPAPGAPVVAGATVSRSAGPAAVAAPPVAAGPDVSGGWAVGKGTQARYRINDNVMGQTSEVVGTTPDVTGTMRIEGATVTAAKVVVNMQTVTCNCVHDSKYHDMLDTDVYPTSSFELTRPIALGAIPAEGQVIHTPVTGNFTIHGVTREVSFALDAVRQAGRVAVNGRIPVKLEDYNIESPDGGPFGSLSDCFIELLVAFDRAS
jgi:polyisoprenoid-binding protein YceI